MKKNILYIVSLSSSLLTVLVYSCKPGNPPVTNDFKTTPYDLVLPPTLSKSYLNIPTDNPLTVEGVTLGKKLFYDKRLSKDNTISCASCHKQEFAFSDAPNAFSTGVDGQKGNRNSMALFNLAFNRDFFWDGRASTLEKQILEPVPNPVEMHQQWKDAIGKLKADEVYRNLFKSAFNTEDFDSTHAAKAVAQFLRTIVSGDAPGQVSQTAMSQDAKDGLVLFNDDNKGDCFHCHPTGNRLLTDNFVLDINQRFHNNGLDPDPAPGTFTGRGMITKIPSDNGKFKAPSLLNIELTAPYMHDGRFKTLEEVMNFYDSGVHMNSNLDAALGAKQDSPNRTFENGKRKLNLTPEEKAKIIAYLRSLTDQKLITNPAYAE